MAKKARRRGGRKPGKWELVDPLEFPRWREQQRLSRARVAELVNVSATSVQNWELGHAVPSRHHQERLAELMKNPSVAGAAPSRGLGPVGDGDPSVVEATGAIVTAYMKGDPKLSPEDLLGLIRTVRQALAGA